jgi:hypothetical protein
MAAPACSLRCARYAASASCLIPPSAFPTLQVVVVLRLHLPVSDQLFAAALVLRDGLAAHPLNVARGEFDRDAVRVLAPVSSTAPFGSRRLASLRIIRSLLPSTRVSYPLPDRPALPFSKLSPILITWSRVLVSELPHDSR